MLPRSLLPIFLLASTVAAPSAFGSAPSTSIKVLHGGAVVVDATSTPGELVHAESGATRLDGYTTLGSDGESNHYQFIIRDGGVDAEFDAEAPAESCLQKVIDPVRQLAVRACPGE